MGLLDLLSKNEIIAQIVGFLLLLTVLRIFLWKRFLKILDDRKARVADEFRKIDDAKTDIEKLKSDYEEKLNAIDSIGKQRIQESVDEGRRIAEELKKGAEEEAQTIITNAKDEIRQEVKKAKEEFRDEIVDIAIAATEKVTQGQVTAEDDKKLVEDFIRKVNKI